MKLGLHAGYWGLGITGDEQLDMAQEADRLGYDSVWAAEAYGSDAATVLAWMAAGTIKIKVASGIFQMPATLLGSPVGATQAERLRMLRDLAEIAG